MKSQACRVIDAAGLTLYGSVLFKKLEEGVLPKARRALGNTVVIASNPLVTGGARKELPVAGGLARELKVIGSSE